MSLFRDSRNNVVIFITRSTDRRKIAQTLIMARRVRARIYSIHGVVMGLLLYPETCGPSFRQWHRRASRSDGRRPVNPRLRNTQAAALIAAVMVTTLLAGCSAPETRPDSGSTATHPAQTGSATPQAMTSRDDLVSPRALAWDSWREVAPTIIEVTFLAGPASCTGIHAAVTETARDITIDLTEGALPGVSECPAIALATTTSVNLSQPLDNRQVRQSAG